MSIEIIAPLETIQGAAEEILVTLDDLDPGIKQTKSHFIKVDECDSVAWVVSRTCDHANGQLVSQYMGKAICRLHGWVLDLDSLDYDNVKCSKKKLSFKQDELDVTIHDDRYSLAPPKGFSLHKTKKATVRFLTHAAVLIDIDGFKIVTDPWFMGPCFTLGWWLAAIPDADVVDVMNGADMVYISHNHPDHFHEETLAHLRKDMPIIVPDFPSKSVERPLQDMGFDHVYAVPFNTAIKLSGHDVGFSVLQAGDFRDDSGLYIFTDGFSALLTVDSNRLNNYLLPKNIDLLMTSFAGGASGYPLCFEHYSLKEQQKIVARHKNAAASAVLRYIDAVDPKVYMPYAGFFTEAANHDAFIKQHNHKNTAQETVERVQKYRKSLKAINPLTYNILTFSDQNLSLSKTSLPPLYSADETYVQGYIKQLEQPLKNYTNNKIIEYFKACKFKAPLKLFILPGDWDFKVADGEDCFAIDFTGSTPKVKSLSEYDCENLYHSGQTDDCNYLLMRIRKAPLWHVINNAKPWEDLSIGFQCRIHRRPDIYNSDFWFYFTNVYIGSAVSNAIATHHNMLEKESIS